MCVIDAGKWTGGARWAVSVSSSPGTGAVLRLRQCSCGMPALAKRRRTGRVRVFFESRARWLCGISYIIMRLVFVATITQHQYARGARANGPRARTRAGAGAHCTPRCFCRDVRAVGVSRSCPSPAASLPSLAANHVHIFYPRIA